MKKLIKFFALIILFFSIENVDASNKYNSISMDIYIDSSGTAHVKETWDVYLDRDTELYKQYTDLNNSEIRNFKVYDNGKLYENIGIWNINASFESKAYSNGINYISNGLELCFGISTYGSHKYVLEYDITNFVEELNDADVVYWGLVKGVKVNKVYIKIYADEPFKDDLDVWGYGNYGGHVYVHDGYIEMSTDGALSSNEYMTILVKFPKNTFDTFNEKVDKNFSDYLKMAEEGSRKYKSNRNDLLMLIIVLIIVVVIKTIPYIIVSLGLNNTVVTMILVTILCIYCNSPILMIAYIILCIKNSKLNLGAYKWKFNKNEKKLPKDVQLYRDIPFNKDIYKFYLIANLYKLSKNKTDLFGAVLLKWLKEGKVEIIKVNSPILKREEEAIKLKEGFTTNYSFELDLYNMMYAASKDGVLESNELKKWCRKNYSKILKWFDEVVLYETNLLIYGGYIEKVREGIFKTEKIYVKTSLYEEAKIAKGLKNFLLEFSKIDSREAIEVVNWEEYLIIAQILGIADKVAQQFKKLYPDVITDYDYDNISFVRNISVSGIRSANNASSYSGGGGGRSSGGGGGGSRGGGSIGSR